MFSASNTWLHRLLAPMLSMPTTHCTNSSDRLSTMSPTLPITVYQPNPDLQIAFDARTRTPVYALERVRPQDWPKIHKRRPNFHEETSLPEPYRSRNSHYKHSGYDRGHMAPAADFNNDPATFTLTNTCPQHAGLNRTLWAQLEGWVRRVAERNATRTTYVLTGPLWLPVQQTRPAEFEYRYPALGHPPSLLHVPTHFFKVVVVVDEHENSITKFACFVIPNTEPDRPSLEDYLVRWTDLEAVIGMKLFPHHSGISEHADALTRGVWETSKKKQPLLLGEPSTTTSKRKRVDCKGLEHLCGTGQCS
jgi:endonuclease G, mitochondrial